GRVRRIEIAGAARARPAPGVLAALRTAGGIVIAPSNPLVSVAPILAVRGVRAALARRRRRVVAISPLVAGRPGKGPLPPPPAPPHARRARPRGFGPWRRALLPRARRHVRPRPGRRGPGLRDRGARHAGRHRRHPDDERRAGRPPCRRRAGRARTPPVTVAVIP